MGDTAVTIAVIVFFALAAVAVIAAVVAASVVSAIESRPGKEAGDED